MAKGQLGAVVRYLRKLAAAQHATDETDEDLLRAFLSHNDQAAFSAIVKRHGPLVMGVCRRVLHHSQDAEDAFQATFLLLARNSASIRKKNSLSSWLHGVAYRMAMNARRAAMQRRRYEGQAKPASPANPADDVAWREMQSILDEEIGRLPKIYRQAFILCCLENKGRAEVARQLRVKEATVWSRLVHARKLLQQRLGRRGVSLSALLGVLALSENTARATVSGGLVSSTVKGALAFAAGNAPAAGLVSAQVAALVKGGLKTMLVTKAKIATALLLTLAVAAGAGALAHQALTANQSDAKADDGPQLVAQHAIRQEPGAQKAARTDRYGDPLPAGAVARLGTVRFLHGGVVRSVAFSPDQKTLASGSDDKTVRLWDVATGKEIRRFVGHDNWVYTVAFSPDGKILASAGIDQRIRLWDIATGSEIKQLLGHEKEVHSIAFSPDGKVLASGSGDKTIRLWDVATGREERRCAGKIGWVGTVVFFPDGRTLVSGSYEDGIHLWDVRSGKELSKPWLPRTGVLGTALSPDGKVLATANGKNDLGTSLWDVATGTMLRKLQTGRREFDRAVFSPDGTTLATGGLFGPVRTWEVSSGKEVSRSEGFESGVSALAISPDGKILVTGSMDHRVRLWQTSTGKQIYPFEGHTGGLRSVDYGSDSKTLFSAGYDGTVRVWDAANAKEVRRFAPYQSNLHVPLAFSPDRQTLMTNVDNKIHFWDLATGKERQRFDRYTGYGIAFFVSPDGNVLAADLREEVIRLYDVRTGKEIRVLAGQQERPHPAAFSADGKWLAAVCFSKADREMRSKLKIWSVETGAELHQFLGQRVPFGSTLAFSPDSKMIAGVADEKIYLWEIATGKKRINLEQGHADFLAFSPDDRTIASGHGDGTVCLWEVATGKRICRFDGHLARIFSVAFSPDGRTLSSGSEDATVLIWDLAGRVNERPPRRVSLVPGELEPLWNDLADGDAAKAFQAMCILETGARQTVLFLQKRLRPVGPVNERILQLISDLDSGSFAVREKATQGLEKLGELAVPALRKALVGNPSAEVQRRIERLLESASRTVLSPSPEWLRTMRALEVLEHIATPESRQLLETLAKGAPEAPLSQEAAMALQRLAKRPSAD